MGYLVVFGFTSICAPLHLSKSIVRILVLIVRMSRGKNGEPGNETVASASSRPEGLLFSPVGSRKTLGTRDAGILSLRMRGGFAVMLVAVL